MNIYIKIYSFYKLKIYINFKIKFKIKIIIYIKRNKLKYFFFKKTLLYNNNKKNLLIINHCCNFKNINHSFKHLFKINHNSIIENILNVIF